MIDIRAELGQIENLAPFPSIVQRILQINGDPESSAKDLSRCIKEDLSLTARILRIVNSAYFGFSRSIGNIEHATVILGFNEVVNIAMALILTRQYPGGRTPMLSRDQFWMHSVATAYVARALSKKARSISAEDAFVAGLLHDIGKVVLDQFFPLELERALTYAKEHDVSMRDAELKLLGIDHCEIGTKIAEHWELPQTLIEAIHHHHDPENGPVESMMPSVTHIANGMCHMYNVGESGTNVVEKTHVYALEKLGLQEDELDTIWDSAHVDEIDLNLYL